jgi:hypothetical protein
VDRLATRRHASVFIATAVCLASLLAPPSRAEARALCRPGSIRCHVSVKDYGARGDGSTDDSRAIQRAIESLPDAGGVVEIPSGTYRLRSATASVGRFPNGSGIRTALVVRRNHVILRGSGSSSVLKLGPSAKMRVISVTGSDVRIESLVVDGNKLERDGGKAYPGGDVVDALVYGSSGSRDIVVTDCKVRDGIEDGIGFWQSIRPRVSGCEVHGNGTIQAKAQGIAVSGAKTRGARVQGNRMWANSWAGIWLAYGASDVSVADNVIRDNDVMGIYVGDGSPASTKTVSRDLRIDRNVVSGNGLLGGELAAGISVTSALDGRLVSNRVLDNYLDGIVFRDDNATAPARWRVQWNTCSNTTITRLQDVGIRVFGRSKSLSIRGNRCANNGGSIEHQIVVDRTARVNPDWATANTRSYEPV